MQEMAEKFADKPDALENTLYIASQCNLDIPFHQSLLPKYPTAPGEASDDMLEEICWQGLKVEGQILHLYMRNAFVMN